METQPKVDHINKTFAFGHDIATSLEKLTEYDIEQHKPSLKTSSSEDKYHESNEWKTKPTERD